MDFVSFGKKQFREIRAVLAGDAGDERFFVHEISRNKAIESIALA